MANPMVLRFVCRPVEASGMSSSTYLDQEKLTGGCKKLFYPLSIFLKNVYLCGNYLTGVAAQAQQNLNWGQGPQVASPDVHADNSVTFNLIAPEAQKVQITGDFLPPKKVEYGGNTYEMPGVADLVKNDKGVWTLTTEPLQPELYTYNMLVDGV